MTDKQELKPCPFCGGARVEKRFDDGLFWVKCNICGSTGPANSRHSCLEDDYWEWNTRATPPEHSEGANHLEVQALVDASERLLNACVAKHPSLKDNLREALAAFNARIPNELTEQAIQELESGNGVRDMSLAAFEKQNQNDSYLRDETTQEVGV